MLKSNTDLKKPLFNVWSFVFFNGISNKEAKLPVDFHKNKKQAINEFSELTNQTNILNASVIAHI